MKGADLKKLRNRLSITQAQAAEIIGAKQYITISNIENNKSKNDFKYNYYFMLVEANVDLFISKAIESLQDNPLFVDVRRGEIGYVVKIAIFGYEIIHDAGTGKFTAITIVSHADNDSYHRVACIADKLNELLCG